MRIELLYTPGCDRYKQAQDILGYIIAEERLPLPVELVALPHQDPSCYHPTVRINGEVLFGLPLRQIGSEEQLRLTLQNKGQDLHYHSIKAA